MSGSKNSLTRPDQIRIGAAAIFFIATFFPFVGASVGGDGLHISVSEDAWHSYAVLGILLVLAAVVIWALERFSSVTLPELPVARNVVIPALAAIGTLLILIRAISYSSPIGLRWGAFILIIAGIVFTAMNYDRTSSAIASRTSGTSSGGTAV